MGLVFGSRLAKWRSARAAVVPYTIRPTSSGGWQLWFLLGIHANSGDITDFGGGIKKYEHDITGGWRELNEETRGIFNTTISVNDFNTCIAAVRNRNEGDGMSVIFVPIGNDWFDAAPKLFDAAIPKEGASHNEISRLMWLCESDFLKLIHIPDEIPDHTMWSRLRKFYASIYTSELHDLLYIRYWWFTPNFVVKRRHTAESHSRRIVVTTTVQYKLSS